MCLLAKSHERELHFWEGGGDGGANSSLGENSALFPKIPLSGMDTDTYVFSCQDMKRFICIQINMKAKDYGRQAPSAALNALQMVRR